MLERVAQLQLYVDVLKPYIARMVHEALRKFTDHGEGEPNDSDIALLRKELNLEENDIALLRTDTEYRTDLITMVIKKRSSTLCC